MLLRNVHTGAICTEKDVVIHYEMDMTYDYLNREDFDEDQEPELMPFSEWLKEMVEEGDYEIVG